MAMANKRARRSKADMTILREAIAAIVEANRPLTIRHLFYLMVRDRHIEKDERDYERVITLAGTMREEWLARYRLEQYYAMKSGDPRRAAFDLDTLIARAGERDSDGNFVSVVIPFGDDYIVDAGRWARKPQTYASMKEALRDAAYGFRRDPWADSPIYVQFFCEKDALAGLICEVTDPWGVPLDVMRGDGSKTSLHKCAKAIEANDRPAMLYFLGDFDVKGQTIIKSAVERLRRYAINVDIQYEVLAVTQDQIVKYNLPTRPEKTDASREAVELDALPPQILRDLINAAIERHVDHDAFEQLKVKERRERTIIEGIAINLPAVQQFLEDGGAFDPE
jgi:hypothetical protein